MFWRKDGKYGCIPGLTPLQFLADHVVAAGFDFNDYISLIHDPRNPTQQALTH